MTPPWRARPAWLGVTFLVICAQLLVWNAYAFHRNQSEFEPYDRFALRPRSIAAVAESYPQEVVRFTFAGYHRMRALAGKKLILPKTHTDQRWWYERVARIDIELKDETPTLPVAAANRLFATKTLLLKLDGATPCGVIIDPAATTYVYVERQGGGEQLILPEAVYQRELGLASRGAP